MRRLTSVKDLAALRAEILAARDASIPTVVIPAGTCGQASGANDLIRAAKREVLDRGPKVRLRITGCHGFCQMEPSILIEPSRAFYPRVAARDVPRIIEAAAAGAVVDGLLFVDPQTGARIPRQDDIPFFRKHK